MHTVCAARAPAMWPYFFRDAALIYVLEMSAVVLFFEDHAASLRRTCCWIFLDNNNCLAALVRGGANAGIIAILAASFWKLVKRFDMRLAPACISGHQPR